MSIIRVRKDAKYFAASNEPFNDTRLSWETRGMMGYLLSKPDGWEVRMADLQKQGPAGRDKLRRMLSEARMYGYMNRIRKTLPGGKFDWTTEVYESPSLNPKPQTSGGFSATGKKKKPVAGLPQVEKPVTGKPVDIVSTDGTSTESDDEGRPLTANIYSLYENNIGAITPMIADALKDAEDTYPADWIADAMRLAVENNKRNWKYCEAILKRWQVEGKDDGKKKQAKGSRKRGTPKKVLTPHQASEEELARQREEFNHG